VTGGARKNSGQSSLFALFGSQEKEL